MTITLPTLHRNQKQIKRERNRFNVLDCGRRFGKNIILQDFTVESALARQLPTGWAAPTYKQLLEDWKNLCNILAPVTTRRNEQEKQLALAGGGVIDFWSLESPDAIRGRKYGRFIVNEAGLVADLVGIWNLVIRPTLIDLTGDGYISGTPKGRNGFWQLFNLSDPDWMRWKMPSYANPHIPKAELDALKATMTDRAFSQEILAEFVEDGGGVFRAVRACATSQPTEPVKSDPDTKQKAHTYAIGVDWGRTNDATPFVVFDIAERRQVAFDYMTDTDYHTQTRRLKALYERYNNAYILAESNSMGGPLIEQLQNEGIPVQGFNTTNATKAQLIDALALAFERRDIAIMDNPLLISELEAYESERLPSGLIRYGAPSGFHDDCVIALALAWQATGSGGAWEWE